MHRRQGMPCLYSGLGHPHKRYEKEEMHFWFRRDKACLVSYAPCLPRACLFCAVRSYLKSHGIMKSLLSLFAILLFSACKTPPEETVQSAGKDTLAVTAQKELLTAKEVDSTDLPSGIFYEGSFKKALRWTDAAGENLLLLTEAPPHPTKTANSEIDYSSDAEIYAYHYLLAGGVSKNTWKVYDFIKDCPVDIVAEFVQKECRITDLNNNGTAEIWLLYKTVCHGDVSPLTMKIICYEGDHKYALRGENKVQVGTLENGAPQYEGGNYTFDAAFQNGPETFRQQALSIWNRNLISIGAE